MGVELLIVEKAKTIVNSAGDTVEVRYGLHVNVAGLDEERIQTDRLRAETMVDGWLAVYQTPRSVLEKPGAPGEIKGAIADIPDLDEADLLLLPFWVGTKKDGHAADKYGGGWVGVDPKYLKEELHKTILARLDQAIRKSPNQKLEFGRFTYEYSGQRKQYITRKPIKEESAR